METYITIICSLTIITNFIVEFIKKYIYNSHITLVAFCVAMVVTFLGVYFKYVPFEIVTDICIGLAVGLASTVGFDKVKEICVSLGWIK